MVIRIDAKHSIMLLPSMLYQAEVLRNFNTNALVALQWKICNEYLEIHPLALYHYT